MGDKMKKNSLVNLYKSSFKVLFVVTAILFSSFPMTSSKAIISNQTDSDSRPQQSTTGPEIPAEVMLQDLQKQEDTIQNKLTEKLINVPSYLWRHGCGPTAVGMVIGFFDANGFPDLVDGDPWSQTNSVDQMIASGGTVEAPFPPQRRGHFEDYSLPIDEPPNMRPDNYLTSGLSAHSSNSVADFMKTSRSEHKNYYGWSWSSDIEPAFTAYVSSRNGHYQPSTSFFYKNMLSWQILVSQINNNRPMVFLVDTNSDGYTDHFVTVIGYRTSPAQQYAVWDTWDNSTIRWEDFNYIQQGVPWGIWGGWSFDVSEIPDLGYEIYLPIAFRN